MVDPQQHPVTVYLDLPAEMQEWLAGVRFEDLIHGQGNTLPDGIEFGDGPLPALPDGTVERGWGPHFSGKDLRDAAIAAAIVINSLSQYTTDRKYEHTACVSQVQEDIGLDNQSRQIRKEPVPIEPGTGLQLHLEALLERPGLCVKFDFKR
jgi:hypothetical protein